MSITFSFEDNGHIIQIDEGDPAHGMRQEPDWFWAALPEKVRLALAKAAPPVAGPWIGEGTCFWREKQSSYNAATCAQFSNGVWRRDGSTTHFHSKEMAMDEADADLRAKGWCLDG